MLIDRMISGAVTTTATRVIDVGCGQAPYRRLLQPEWYVGADRMPRVGRTDVVADVAALPVADAAFDGVVCTEVIEHVPDERALARELARVARPGAALLLSSPFVHGLHEQPYDFRRLTSIGLVSVLEEAGWEVRSVSAIGGPLVVAVDSAVRATDSWLRRIARRIPGASGPALRLQTAVSAAVQRLLGTVALRSPIGHLRRIDPAGAGLHRVEAPLPLVGEHALVPDHGKTPAGAQHPGRLLRGGDRIQPMTGLRDEDRISGLVGLP